MSLPQYLFVIIALLPTIIIGIIFLFLGFTSFADVKVVLVAFTISLLVASLAYIFLKSILKSVIVGIGNTKKFEKAKFSLTATLILQLSSMLFVCVLYTFLLSYSNNLEDKAKVLSEHYRQEIQSVISYSNINSIDSLKEVLSNLEFISPNDAVFLIDENGEFINFTNAEVTDFFMKYALDLSKDNNNLVYDYYGTESQGTVIPLKIDGKSINVVVKYDLSNSFLIPIFSNLIIIVIYCIISIYFFSTSVSNEISLVADNMKNISEKNSSDRIGEKLSVTSNNEIGDLVIAFNDVQELTGKYISQIENNQQVLLEQERLASLGQMIGGIAHNMKTPIMSVSGAAEGLTELVGEYIASINNPQVTAEDHKEIAKDMLDWITKIKTHTAYMSDIITAVKGQASQLATSDYSEFTVYDLSKKVDILIKHEIKKALLTLETTIECDPTLTIHGDINNLIQVLINLISNSIQSYEGKAGEKIYFTINADHQNIYFTVKDTGCGMPEETKEKLFKEMFTTKGKNGTGLGLYMSYSTIKGKFNGNISFESEVGKGTTFVVEIPIEKEEY
ncbi:MAG: HAMP domain-containing histidine kinase [Clostridia bacterium]|nr:HAMP domain-containing histidine kinase [Clostridia bacterium]